MGTLIQWVFIITIISIVALIYDRYEKLIRHEDEKVNEVWEFLKKGYIDPIDRLSNMSPTYDYQSERIQKKMDVLNEKLNSELKVKEIYYGRIFRRKLDRKYQNYMIAKIER